MALDKLVDSSQLNSNLTSIANAIRSKSGTQESLSFPAGFVEAIGDISTGTDVSNTTATAADVRVGKYFYTSSGVRTQGTIQNQSARTITPGTSNQVIASGKYLSGAQTIRGDENLIAGNIKSGVTIFDVLGTFEGSGDSSIKYAKYTYDGNQFSFSGGEELTQAEYNAAWVAGVCYGYGSADEKFNVFGSDGITNIDVNDTSMQNHYDMYVSFTGGDSFDLLSDGLAPSFSRGDIYFFVIPGASIAVSRYDYEPATNSFEFNTGIDYQVSGDFSWIIGYANGNDGTYIISRKPEMATSVYVYNNNIEETIECNYNFSYDGIEPGKFVFGSTFEDLGIAEAQLFVLPSDESAQYSETAKKVAKFIYSENDEAFVFSGGDAITSQDLQENAYIIGTESSGGRYVFSSVYWDDQTIFVCDSNIGETSDSEATISSTLHIEFANPSAYDLTDGESVLYVLFGQEQ